MASTEEKNDQGILETPDAADTVTSLIAPKAPASITDDATIQSINKLLKKPVQPETISRRPLQKTALEAEAIQITFNAITTLVKKFSQKRIMRIDALQELQTIINNLITKYPEAINNPSILSGSLKAFGIFLKQLELGNNSGHGKKYYLDSRRFGKFAETLLIHTEVAISNFDMSQIAETMDGLNYMGYQKYSTNLREIKNRGLAKAIALIDFKPHQNSVYRSEIIAIMIDLGKFEYNRIDGRVATFVAKILPILKLHLQDCDSFQLSQISRALSKLEYQYSDFPEFIDSLIACCPTEFKRTNRLFIISNTLRALAEIQTPQSSIKKIFNEIETGKFAKSIDEINDSENIRDLYLVYIYYDLPLPNWILTHEKALKKAAPVQYINPTESHFISDLKKLPIIDHRNISSQEPVLGFRPDSSVTLIKNHKAYRLAVELDGPKHYVVGRLRNRDQFRDRVLRNGAGVITVRITSDEYEKYGPTIIEEKIAAAIEQQEIKNSPPEHQADDDTTQTSIIEPPAETIPSSKVPPTASMPIITAPAQSPLSSEVPPPLKPPQTLLRQILALFHMQK